MTWLPSSVYCAGQGHVSNYVTVVALLESAADMHHLGVGLPEVDRNLNVCGMYVYTLHTYSDK